MENIYRVSYKIGSFEIEVESSDKEYVDSKLRELLARGGDKAIQIEQRDKKVVRPENMTPKKSGETSDRTEVEGSIDIAAIVSAINDNDDHEKIEINILNKSGQLPRIIMCLYFAEDVYGAPITTGDIHSITDQLGIKISAANAGTTIKNHQKYFAADTVRKKGAVIKYKLNRKGNEAYKKLLNGENI